MEHWRLTSLLKDYWEDDEKVCSGSYKIINNNKIQIEYAARHVQFTGWENSIFNMEDVLDKIKTNIKIEIDTKISEIDNLEYDLKKVEEEIKQ